MRGYTAAHRHYKQRTITVFSSGRLQLRSWMFIYLGLIAAFVLAGDPANSGANGASAAPTPAMNARSPLLRHDI
jgi:hypothetical protein